MTAKPPIDPASSKRLKIRLLTEADLETTREWRNHPETRRHFFFDEVLTRADHQKWFNTYQTKANDLVFVLEAIDSGAPIGQAALYDIDWDVGIAEFGRFMIGDIYQRSLGLGKEALALTCFVGFKTLSLNTIYLEVKPDNIGAWKTYIKLGFEEKYRDDQVVKMELVKHKWMDRASTFLN